MKLVRHHRPEEALADTIKPVMRGNRDSQRATGTEKAQTKLVAEAALEAADAASETADGKSSVVRSTSPATAAGSYQEGDQWWQFSGANIVGLWLHDGTDWEPQALTDAIIATLDAGKITTGVLAADRIGANSITAAKIAAEAITTDKLAALAVTAEKLAAGSVIAEKIAAEAITAEKIAAGAIDAMTIRSAQIFGGYIEAPVIASSDKLGSGANTLTDPGFTSTVNTAWVASGHLGDAAVTQTDTIAWDQTWEYNNLSGGYTAVRNYGSVVADLVATPAVRKTGSLLFANYSWLNTAPRTLSNPHTFPSPVGFFQATQTLGGRDDHTFRAVDSRAPGAGVSRTTYLTNSAVVAVVAGERWNARITFTKLSAEKRAFISAVALEVLNSSTSAVVWSRTLTNDEIAGGFVNDWWDANYTGNVRFRVKAIYTAAGGNIRRKPRVGGYARIGPTDVNNGSWDAGASDESSYSVGPAIESGSGLQELQGTHGADYQHRARAMELVATSAMFAKVEPEKGWRLTEGSGLELFNSLGAKTGQLDGEDNFLAGRFGTAESGVRWEMNSDQLNLYNAAGSLINSIRRDGTGTNMQGSFTLNGKPLTSEESLTLSMLTIRSGYTLQAGSWVQKRSDGFVRGLLIVKRSSGAISADTNGADLLTLPAGWRPAGAWEGACATSQGGNAGISFGQITGGGAVRAWNPITGNQQAAWQFEFQTA